MKFPKPHRSSKPFEEPQASKNKLKGKPKGDTMGVEAKGIKDLGSRIPEWFLENCSQTAEELTDLKIPLNIRDKLCTDGKREKEPEGAAVDVYEVLTVVYEPLLSLFLSTPKAEAQAQESKSKAAKAFSKEAVFLRFPGKHSRKGGIQFLIAIVQQFARDIKADLITVGLDDLDDLVQDLCRPKEKIEAASEKKQNDNDSPAKAAEKSEDSKGKAKDSHVTEVVWLCSNEQLRT